MLFEADSETMIQDGEGNSIPSYKGGSGGAYEKFWKETAGAVVAILNPSILKNRPVRLFSLFSRFFFLMIFLFYFGGSNGNR